MYLVVSRTVLGSMENSHWQEVQATSSLPHADQIYSLTIVSVTTVSFPSPVEAWGGWVSALVWALIKAALGCPSRDGSCRHDGSAA